MLVDLRTIPVFVITCGSDDRRSHILAHMEHDGIHPEFIDGIKCNPGIIGCGLSHLKVLSSNPKTPFMVLEDDCATSAEFDRTIDVPTDVDAVYLGVSVWGALKHQTTAVKWGAKSTRFDARFLRLHNMCSSHAILYTAARHVKESSRIILDCILRGIPFDIGLALLQSEHLVLTPNIPWYYQAARLGGNQDDTEKALIPTIC